MQVVIQQGKTDLVQTKGIRIETYHPNSKQTLIHQSQATFKNMLGAFGSGKSRCGCEEGFKLSMSYPGNIGLVCRKDYTTLKDSTMKTWFEMVPLNSPLVESWNQTTHDLYLKTPGGKPSLIMFRGADEYQQFGSYELGWFFIDQAEQVKEEVFVMLQNRLRHQGVKHCGIITPNPPSQYHWIHRIFEKQYKNDPDYVSVHTSTYDNKENLPGPYLERLEKMPDNWKKMYLYGEYGFMAEGDPVYADFRSETHVAKEPLQVIKGLPIIRSWDFGYLYPACGFYQISKTNDRIYKLAELIGQNMIIDKFADTVIQYALQRFPNTKFVDCGDPAGEQHNDKSEHTSVEILATKGVTPFNCQRSFIKDGLNLIRRYLIVRDDGKPSYVIDPSCRITEETYIGGYYLSKDSDMPDDNCHPYCDVADTDRYAFMNNVSISEPKRDEVFRSPQIKRHSVTGY